jgi:CDP-diacylglycerol---serine O-phosphatidyltransferase
MLENKERKRGIYLLPNLLTLSALFAGFYAIIYAVRGSYTQAAIAILVAMVMDALDGRVARLTNTVTAFGAEFDSLSDMVCFGVAPALTIYHWALASLGKIGWLAAFIFTAAVALRLARFNTQIGKDSTSKRYSQGLACTPGAGVIASIIWVGKDWGINQQHVVIPLALLTILIGVFMVSNIRYRSFKDFDVKEHVSFVVILLLVVFLVLVSLSPALILFILFFGYALSGPVATIWALRKKRLERKGKVLRFKGKK